MLKPVCRCAVTCGLWAKFRKFAHSKRNIMKNRPLDRLFHKKKADQKEVIKENLPPTQEEVDAVEVYTTSHTVKSLIPLLPREEDVWVVCGKGIGLRGETVGKIRSGLLRKGYDIQYYDKVFGGITKEALDYNFPDLEVEVEQLSAESFVQALRDGLGLEIPELSILFIRYEGKTEPDLFGNGPEDCFSVFDASAPNAHDFLTNAFAYIQSLKACHCTRFRYADGGGSSNVRFSITRKDDDSQILFRDGDNDGMEDIPPATPDELFDREMDKLAEETYSGLERLVLSGYSIDVIEGWLNKLSRRSRVVITDKFKILLPDYQNREVVMNQLPKALFLFFLKHDRAYAIYQMQEQKRELMDIYQKLTNSNDLETIEQRIDSLVNPDGVSFVEKCSMIRRAFNGLVPMRFVSEYYIQGPQGEAKCISLDRSLVEWNVKI